MQLCKAVVNAHHYLKRQKIHSSLQRSRVRPQRGEHLTVKEATKGEGCEILSTCDATRNLIDNYKYLSLIMSGSVARPSQLRATKLFGD